MYQRTLLVMLIAVLAPLLAPIKTCAQDAQANGDEAVATDTLRAWKGTWSSTFGPFTLSHTGEGELGGRYSIGVIEHARLDGAKLRFNYVERNVRGEGWFELADDGQSFSGQWRREGHSRWSAWDGTRTAEPEGAWHGLWTTNFGNMRLIQEPSDADVGKIVTGAYSWSTGSSVTGSVDGRRLTFGSDEDTANAEGWLALAEDGESFEGEWRREGQDIWHPLTGSRVHPSPGVQWLVILEAHWESGLAEREFAFGDMLQSYFTMSLAKGVEVRHRFFHDADDFTRFAQETLYLAEPVTLVVSSHGSPGGVWVNRTTIDSEAVADALRHAGNLKLLHLSGCAMMSGPLPNDIHQALRNGPQFPISGYSESVAWDASAISDFVYLSMVLLRRLSPAEAVAQTHLVAPYTTHDHVKGAVFAPMGLSIRQAPADK